jgi:hypothetical protein
MLNFFLLFFFMLVSKMADIHAIGFIVLEAVLGSASVARLSFQQGSVPVLPADLLHADCRSFVLACFGSPSPRALLSVCPRVCLSSCTVIVIVIIIVLLFVTHRCTRKNDHDKTAPYMTRLIHHAFVSPSPSHPLSRSGGLVSSSPRSLVTTAHSIVPGHTPSPKDTVSLRHDTFLSSHHPLSQSQAIHSHIDNLTRHHDHDAMISSSPQLNLQTGFSFFLSLCLE